MDGRAVTLDLGRAFLGTIEGTTDLQSAAAGCSDTPVMCPLDWILHTTTEAGYRHLSCSSNFRRRRCHSPKAPAAPQPHTQRPPAGARLAAGLSLDRTGNGRPNQTRDLVPFLKQKYREAKVAGVKAGRSSTAGDAIFHRLRPI